MKLTESTKTFLFRLRHCFCGYPKTLAGRRVRIDESLRRYNVENEADVANEITNLLPKGGLFVDVGANIGLHTLLAALHMAERGLSVAVEPVPANLRLLQKNIKLNGLGARCRVYPCALGKVDGSAVRMSVEDGLSPAARLGDVSGAFDTIEVQSRTLDSIVESLGRVPDLVKIDVEGAEHEVLKGAGRTLFHGPDLLVEIHAYALPEFGSSAVMVTEHLRSAGYTERRIGAPKESKLGSYYHSVFTKHR